jgi:hypothetical protein
MATSNTCRQGTQSHISHQEVQSHIELTVHHKAGMRWFILGVCKCEARYDPAKLHSSPPTTTL